MDLGSVSVAFFFFFYLSAVAIGGFYIFMPLESYNGPLRAGFANWM